MINRSKIDSELFRKKLITLEWTKLINKSTSRVGQNIFKGFKSWGKTMVNLPFSGPSFIKSFVYGGTDAVGRLFFMRSIKFSLALGASSVLLMTMLEPLAITLVCGGSVLASSNLVDFLIQKKLFSKKEAKIFQRLSQAEGDNNSVNTIQYLIKKISIDDINELLNKTKSENSLSVEDVRFQAKIHYLFDTFGQTKKVADNEQLKCESSPKLKK